ncbi:hypothetical protein EIP91_001183 [Steccherinum ochraceum]|uniref:Uncharacterized protein n=1 Tax=Steccherinum ochraceum TaxID=92696 RepID=A0A4R0RVT9_9APHY|nr:hypothetical protein EIP91_001183 [Steccherinum ochraceum]
MYPAVARVARSRTNFARCCCGRSFKPEKDMETYCSTQCSRDDTLRALMGEDNAYRQKIQARRKEHPQKNAGRKYAEKLIPRLFASADRQLPPAPPPKPYAPALLYSTKENKPPSAPRPNISGPYALQPQPYAITRPPLGPSSSRLHLPGIDNSLPSGPRLVKKPSQHALKPRTPATGARKDPRAVRRSASESRLKNAASNAAHGQQQYLRDPLPLTYYQQPPRVAEIRPTVLAPVPAVAHSPYRQVPGQRHLRHSKSFSPAKPFFPANVPEDVNQDGLSYRISGDVWWVVNGLREGGDVDYKAQFLARQTPRW